MAQNITIQGASYTEVPSILLPKTGGGTASFVDVTGTTAAAADVASGKIFFAADGTQTTGTASGGGGYGYTLLTTTEVTVSTTSTTAAEVATLTRTDTWTSAKVIYVRVRDKAGPRNGYYYGMDVWIVNAFAANSSTSNFYSFPRVVLRKDSSSNWQVYTCTSQSNFIGVGPYYVTPTKLVIGRKYNSNNTTTINGTFKVEVYGLDYPDGVSPF